ncbi:unnamed protein product [Ambrosiozyma monospora]|uniref:Unnamed protein product n=1 Tax=Ambrosiozyma monospora TaxID=43982 RepID=A0A9W6Z2J7_AMBMO|nr:unnamed protein product [Ambrosiozyma monospora]
MDIALAFQRIMVDLPSITYNHTTQPKTLPNSVNPTIVGNNYYTSPEFTKALKTGNDNEKIKIVIKLRESISSIAVSSIPEIWYKVRSLIRPNVNPNLRRETLMLLQVCIKSRGLDNTTATKLMFYKDIVDNCQVNEHSISDPNFELFLRCLVELTDNGRDIYDLLIYSNYPFANYIIQVLEVMRDSEIIFSRKEFIGLVGNCLKFNFNLFQTSQTNTIIRLVIEIAKSTSAVETLKACIGVCSNIVVFGTIQTVHLQGVVSLLAGASTIQDGNMNSLAFTEFENLLRHPSVSYLTMLDVCDTIQGKGGGGKKGTLGSIRFINHCLRYYGDDSVGNMGDSITMFFDNTFGLVLEVLKVASDSKDLVFIVAILRTLCSVLELNVIKPHYLTSGGAGAYNLFWNLIDNLYIQAGSTAYIEALHKLFTELLKFKSNPLIVPQLIQVFERFHDYITPDLLPNVLSCYSDSLACIFLTPGWTNACHSLYTNYYDVSPNLVFNSLKDTFLSSLAITKDKEVSSEYLKILLSGRTLSQGESLHSIVDLLKQLDFEDGLFQDAIHEIRETIINNFGKGQKLAQIMVLLTLELSRSSLNSRKVDYLLDVGIGMANFALDTAQYDLFLIFARLFTSMRRNHAASDSEADGNDNLGYYFFYNVDNIDGLCDILGRNMKFIPDNRKDSVINSSLWVRTSQMDKNVR